MLERELLPVCHSAITIRLFGWLLPVARLHQPYRQRCEQIRDANNLLAHVLAHAEPGPGALSIVLA